VNKKILITILLTCYITILLIIIWQIYLKYFKLRKIIPPHLSPSLTSSLPASVSRPPQPTLNFTQAITLESIFSSDRLWINQLPQEEIVTIITTGDVIPARSVNFKMNQYNDFSYPFEKTAALLKTADITLINLEAPLVKDCPLTNEGMIFCGNQKFVKGLLFAGVDVANLANNHISNWGSDGIQQTTALLQENKILFSGVVSDVTIQEVKGLKVGFLGWNLLDKIEKGEILNTIKAFRARVDLLVVSVHWGEEYQAFPAVWQREFAKQMIDVGADLVVGNHSHWAQPVEIYNNKLIIYSHGNFVFDQEWSQETKTGFIAKHTFFNKRVIDSQLIPVFIKDYSQPEFLEGVKKELVLIDLREKSWQLIKAR
jgi:poly-gamma-glutamate synthesis protein (capsule biosynthesis protein)